MAPLKVIGVGWGRTGTDSLREALEILGFHTHHMRVMYENMEESNPESFKQAFENPTQVVDWNEIYKNYDAAVDWPTVAFADRLVEYYPDAKIILTFRDTEKWYNSVKDTIMKILKEEVNSINTDPETVCVKNVLDMSRTVIMDGLFKHSNPTATMSSEEEASLVKAKYEAHIEWVKNNVPKERLLIMKLGEGWEHLCSFLDKPVPNLPYPHTNSRKAFNNVVMEGGNVSHPFANQQ